MAPDEDHRTAGQRGTVRAALRCNTVATALLRAAQTAKTTGSTVCSVVTSRTGGRMTPAECLLPPWSPEPGMGAIGAPKSEPDRHMTRSVELAEEPLLHDRHDQPALTVVDPAPGQTAATDRDGRLLVVQQPVVGPERAVEPHGVVQ